MRTGDSDVSIWDTYRLSCTSVQRECKGGACQSCAYIRITLVGLTSTYDPDRAVQGVIQLAFTVRVANLVGLCCRLLALTRAQLFCRLAG